MTSIDMQEIADSSSIWANGQLRPVLVKPDYGSGSLADVKSFQSGISIVMQNFTLYGNGKVRICEAEDKKSAPVIAFFTCFSGVEGVSYSDPRVSLGNGFSYIEYPGYKPGLFMEVKTNTPVQTISVCMDPVVFNRLTGKTGNELVESLSILDHKACKKVNPTGSRNLDFDLRLCGYKVLKACMNSSQDLLFIEAKALELTSLLIRQLDISTGKIAQKKVAHYDLDKISHACEILRKELANPPRLIELALMVGFNHNNLIQGFKEVLGVSPFEYLRIVRLEKARELIERGECNVTEAAFNVGYSSLSHFSKIFREEFGVNPKSCT